MIHYRSKLELNMQTQQYKNLTQCWIHYQIFRSLTEHYNRRAQQSHLKMKNFVAIATLLCAISAPGHSIVSAGNSNPNHYSVMSGTSMATPHVAGAVALIKSRQPNMSVDNVIARLQSIAAYPPISHPDKSCGTSLWPNMAFGYGRINVAAVLP